uniref:Superoxide dismutase [Cu-Zn] n=1 Tax=Aplanochytrium stocchinoi TaxID=215587 RepID=A0A7S3V0J4_9STRA|mmetsp:Transcript_12620/g.14506  ORF Transcript_12620/g.14506 Transcript_12620/m.14506 type:complete len:182 (+) Transcript_12620:392-937(+)
MIAVVHRTKPFKTICFVLICEYASKGNSGVSGTVFFVGGHNLPTKITAEIHGLSKGKHGFHIHEFGNLTEGCKTAGGHYNPHNSTHGAPSDPKGKRHIGDLGNVICKKDGEKAVFELTDAHVRLSGPYSVIGRSVVAHADEDDLGKGGYEDSLTTGHAGGRVACGVIGLAEESYDKGRAGI